MKILNSHSHFHPPEEPFLPYTKQMNISKLEHDFALVSVAGLSFLVP